MPRVLSAFVLAGLALGAAGPSARADVTGQLESIGKATGYVVPAGGAAITSIVNGLSIAYDEGSPKPWRIAGYLCGGVELGIGVGMLTLADHTQENTVLGIVPLVLGAAAIGTAWFAPVPNDIVGGVALAPLVAPGTAGLAIGGRF